MATTKIWPVKDSLARVVDYAQNPDKTVYSDLQKVLHYAANEEKSVEGAERAMFVTGVNCNRDTGSQMYALSKELQSSNKLRNIEQEISYKRYQDQKYATEMHLGVFVPVTATTTAVSP